MAPTLPRLPVRRAPSAHMGASDAGRRGRRRTPAPGPRRFPGPHPDDGTGGDEGVRRRVSPDEWSGLTPP